MGSAASYKTVNIFLNIVVVGYPAEQLQSQRKQVGWGRKIVVAQVWDSTDLHG